MPLVLDECTQLRMNSDLNLTLGPNNGDQKSLNAEPGVGANAASRAELAILGDDDPLAELVWSPRKGLIVRSAVGSVLEKKSSIFWEAELSKMVLSPSYSIATENFIDKVSQKRDLADEPDLFAASKGEAMNTQMCRLDIGRDSGSSEKMTKINTAVVPNSLRDEGNSNTKRDLADEPDLVAASKGDAMNTQMCKLDIGRDSGSDEKKTEINTAVVPNSLRDDGNSNTIEVAETIGSHSPGAEEGRTSNVLPVSDELDHKITPAKFLPGGSNDMKICGALDINYEKGQTCQQSPVKGNLYQEVQDLRNSTALNTQEFVQSNAELMEDGPNKMIGAVSACALPVEKMETATGKEQIQLEACPVNKASPINSFITKRKGKEKSVVFNGDTKEEAVEDSEDSYESVESRNTLRLVGSRKKRSEQLFVRCKRLKVQNQEPPDFTPLTRSDGSFVNWISTLAKDISRPVEKKGLIVCSRVQNHKCGNTGFQSLFGSLYQPNPKAEDQTLISCDDQTTSEGCENLEVVEKPFENSGSYLATQDSVKEQNQLSNLWLAHFCPKSSGVVLNSAKSRLGKESKKSHIPLDAELSCGVKSIEGKKFNPMVSIFAKRVDAFKEVLQTNLVDKANSSTTTTCFFCGVFGHDLRHCPQVTNSEVNELLNDVTNYSGAEESSCFCIKCFQHNHWAVACPNAISVNKNEMLHCEMPDRVDVNLEIGESSASLRRISPNLERVGFYCAEENDSKAPSICHPCTSFGNQVVDIPRGIFEVVKNLRLSRTDILKRLYSTVSMSNLDGYYVRLRLGKPEEGLGGTGYHVACITGLQGVEPAETSKKPISVIVAGVRCSVESQYISNQDFSEDELMAWWSATVKGGGKIPSADELMVKFEERRRLGL